MYPGVMKQFISLTYEEIRRKEIAKKLELSNMSSKPSAVKTNLDSKTESIKSMKKFIGKDLSVSKDILSSDFKEMKSKNFYNEQMLSNPVKMKMLYKHCNYPAELFNFDETTIDSIKNKVGGELKPWLSLSNSEKQEIIDLILPKTWILTLVHELGHNLGLRHNFEGSEDKENFYSSSELKKMNIDHSIPSSTVMEYASNLNRLPTLGKYDIAALRFAYQREVETKSGEIIKLKNNLSELPAEKIKDLKDYGYCTDENVGASIGCNRHDEGTTFTEIVNHYIKEYKILHETRNYRNGRPSMSSADDHKYAGRVWGTFSKLRMTLNSMSLIKNKYGINYNNQIYEKNEYLQDMKQASLISLDFLISVISTPDVNCVVANSKTKEISNVPLATFSKNYTSCQDITLKDGYSLVSQFGTFLNHIKDQNSVYSDISQIDIRGIWIDKLLATRALFDRRLSSASINSTDNFLDLAEGQKKIPEMLALFADGSATSEVSLTSKDGQSTKVPVTVSFADEMMVKKTMSPELMKALSLPDRDFYLSEWIYNYAKSTLRNTAEINYVGESFADFLSVSKIKSNQPVNVNPDKTKGYQFGEYTYLASTEKNPIAASIIQNIDMMELFNSKELRQEKLKLIVESKLAGKEIDTADLNEVEKEVAKLSKEQLKQILNNKIPSHGYLIRLLNVMAN